MSYTYLNGGGFLVINDTRHTRGYQVTRLFSCSCRFLQVIFLFAEAATRGVLKEKVFLEISQNSQENTCARDSFLIKVQA